MPGTGAGLVSTARRADVNAEPSESRLYQRHCWSGDTFEKTYFNLLLRNEDTGSEENNADTLRQLASPYADTFCSCARCNARAEHTYPRPNERTEHSR